MIHESYRGRTFSVCDPDARLRKADALHEFVMAGGKPATIPDGTKVKVDAVRVVPAGAEAVVIYVHALAEPGGAPLGWTSAANLEGRFLSETVGKLPPPPNASRFGPNAAWQSDEYLGQVTLIEVVGTEREIKRIAEATCEKFLAMVDAARAAGVTIGLNSGFRSWPEQKFLFDGRQRGLPGFAPANRPGNSNHQNGIAFDISVGGGGSNPTYVWLSKNATGFGFVRTVKSEAWHWEFLPEKAAKAKSKGVCTIWE